MYYFQCCYHHRVFANDIIHMPHTIEGLKNKFDILATYVTPMD
jgi:hypothetical protein